ncbi:phosphoacetylglucosamine mutase [Benincasa hispida]|uniref:phosphoacetylglucosamine mutase n=1 Tax=Benincasa hispida TaxID=102211 RepID=UPI00190121A9|nr:phosphoacetylglucosamine mutase [Benincasa hispida]XP_038880075.1 phosphoacetylglucosamine mutase [Benincasa hispida]
MNEKQRGLLLRESDRFPPPQGVRLSYGTAGFREDASVLLSTVYRVGILAALRALKTGRVIGLMITASHNKVSDNGVKVADPSGGMLTQEWEPFANALANAPSSQDLVRLINEFAEKENILLDGSKSAHVLVARDTRPSGEVLLDAAKHGIGSIIWVDARDMGILTTPQLHWMVRIQNKGLRGSELDYFYELSESFRCLFNSNPNNSKLNDWDNQLVVDGANGVGGQKLELLKEKLNGLAIEIRNSGKGEGVLNEGVGADFVQKEKIVPCSFGSQDVGIRCASFDGDADRLVYFTVPSESRNRINLVDGDKILSLFAIFIKEQLTILAARSKTSKIAFQPRLGVVQTAYANGASTRYLKELGLEVEFTPTGVKYLHEKAAEYDIGIYFEANGHGTILFSDYFLTVLQPIYWELSDISADSEPCKAALRLLAVSQLINQAVGDALSGLLLVEAILRHKNWSIHKWSELYQDLPSRQLKVKVVDRTAVETNNAETEVVKPPGIQEAINLETAKYPEGRCFIRPSGTEDVIRVYAEASTQEAADDLATSVAKLVDQFLGAGSSK